jgi:hypothetical protein
MCCSYPGACYRSLLLADATPQSSHTKNSSLDSIGVIMSESGQAGTPAQDEPSAGTEISPRDTGTTSAVSPQDATTTAARSLAFDLTTSTDTYNFALAVPDSTGSYSVKVTQTATGSTATPVTIASFSYQSSTNWNVTASLPKALKVDENLTINTLTIDIGQGTPPATPPSS